MKMNCTQCGSHFCWLCNEFISGYEHFFMDESCMDQGFYVPSLEEQIKIWEKVHNRKYSDGSIIDPTLENKNNNPNNNELPTGSRKKSKLKSAKKFGLYAVG